MQVRNRILGLKLVPAKELAPNPRNWRVHSKEQREALQGILAEVGFADALLVREREDGRLELIDGHLRAETLPEMEVPVLVLDVSEEEAKKLLVTVDPLARLAGTDAAKLEELVAGVSFESEAVSRMLEDLCRESAGLGSLGAAVPGMSGPDAAADPPDEFKAFDETIEVEHRCPKCGYEWSGKPA